MIGRIWSATLTESELQKAIGFHGSVLCLAKKYEFNDCAEFDCGGVEIGVRTGGRGRSPGRVNRASNYSLTTWMAPAGDSRCKA
jgi:hypothetical protein